MRALVGVDPVGPRPWRTSSLSNSVVTFASWLQSNVLSMVALASTPLTDVVVSPRRSSAALPVSVVLTVRVIVVAPAGDAATIRRRSTARE